MGTQAHGAREWQIVGALGITVGTMFASLHGFIFLTPLIKQDIPLTDTQVGMLALATGISSAFSAMFLTRLADRLERRKAILLWAVLGFTLTTAATALVSNVGWLVVNRVLLGLCLGPILPIAHSIVVDQTTEHRRGVNMGVLQSVMPNAMGNILAPIILIHIASSAGWRWAFAAVALPGLLMLLPLARGVREPARHEHGDTGRKPGMMDVVRHRNIALSMAISGLMGGWMLLSLIFVPLVLVDTGEVSPRKLSYLFGGLGAVGTLAGFVLPWLSDRYGRRPVTIASCVIALAAPAATPMLPMPVAPYMVMLAFGWMAVGSFSIFMATIPAESVGAAHTATAVGLASATAQIIGTAVLPAIAGVVADYAGSRDAIFVMQAVLVLAATVLAFLLLETRRRAPLAAEQVPVRVGG